MNKSNDNNNNNIDKNKLDDYDRDGIHEYILDKRVAMLFTPSFSFFLLHRLLESINKWKT